MHPLERKLETEVMDTPEEAAEYDSMDHSEVNVQFVDDLLARFDPSGEILDLGAGSARIPIELCGRDENVRIVAIDMSVNMLDTARINLELAGLVEQILLDRQDAKALPYRNERFAAVISNSIIHHIPDPSEVLAEAVRVVAPDGSLFFRDLMRPHNEAALQTLVSTYAGRESQPARQMFEDSLRAALTLDEIQDLVQAAGFDPDSVQPTSDRHWTWVARQEK